MTDPLAWELTLPNGTVLREPPDGASIRTAPKGATELRIVAPDGRVVHAVGLRDENGRFARPVFYRRRYLDLKANGDQSTVGATVFGWGRETDSAFEGYLWAAEGGQVRECPERLKDAAMVTIQVADVTPEELR